MKDTVIEEFEDQVSTSTFAETMPNNIRPKHRLWKSGNRRPLITKTYHPSEPDRSPEEAKRKLMDVDGRFVARMRLCHPELEGVFPTIAGDYVPRTFHRHVDVQSKGID